VSKQPHYKYAAVSLEKVARPTTRQPEQVHPDPAAQPAAGASGRLKETAQAAVTALKHLKPPRAHIADYLGLLQLSEQRLVRAFEQVRHTHPDEPDLGTMCQQFEQWSSQAARSLDPFVARYGERVEGEPERLDEALLVQRKPNAFDLLRDLHDLWLLVNESLISVDVMEQAANALRDKALVEAIQQIRDRNKRQGDWLRTRIRQAAPQVLVVPS